jgi:hypothetical protein
MPANVGATGDQSGPLGNRGSPNRAEATEFKWPRDEVGYQALIVSTLLYCGLRLCDYIR